MRKSGSIKQRVLITCLFLCVVCLITGVSALTAGSTENPGNMRVNPLVHNVTIQERAQDLEIIALSGNWGYYDVDPQKHPIRNATIVLYYKGTLWGVEEVKAGGLFNEEI